MNKLANVIDRNIGKITGLVLLVGGLSCAGYIGDKLESYIPKTPLIKTNNQNYYNTGNIVHQVYTKTNNYGELKNE